MAVIPSLNFNQSSDGKTLTLIDTSDYTTGTIGNYTRKVELYSGINGTGTLIDTLNFTGTSLTVEKEITSDVYLSAKFIFTGSPSVTTTYMNFGTTQFEYISLDKRLLNNCGCNNCKGCDKTTLGALYLKRAEDQVLFGNPAKFNSFIQASLKVLNS